MKPAMCTKMTADMDLFGALKTAGMIGYEGVEIFCVPNQLPVDTPPDTVRRAREILDHYGCRTVCLATYAGGAGRLTAETGEAFLQDVRSYMAMADVLGCRLIRVGVAPVPSAQAGPEVWSNAGRWLNEVCRMTAAVGMRPVVETHAGQLADSAPGCLRLIEAAGHDNLAFTWDAGSLAPDLEVDYGPAAIATVKERIAYAQVNDFRRSDGRRVYVFTGEGEVDNASMIRGLRAVGYDGFVGAESHRPPDEWYDSRGVAEREYRLMSRLLQS